MKQCECCAEKCEEDEEPRYWPLILSSIIMFAGIVLQNSSVEWFASISIFWYVAAYLPVGLPVVREAIKGMKGHEVFSEYTLMTIATIGAFCIGEYPEGVAVMLFYAIGETLQDKAVDKAKHNISKTLDTRPETVTILHGNNNSVVSPKDVIIGDIMEVKPGERISLDGILQSDEAFFYTSSLTGESVPRAVHRGEKVYAGTLATDKPVTIEVTAIYEKSMLARILELVEDASERKAPTELFIRKFAKIYTPVVISLAALVVLTPYIYSLINPAFTFEFSKWLYRALTFLVVSCPCALVVSIPLGYFIAIGAASKHGILFKGSNYLDAILHINAVVFDKTGTLTRGVFNVQSIDAVGYSEEQLLQWTASLENQSTHPIAKAIVLMAGQKNISLQSVNDVTDIAGYGLKGRIIEHEIAVGNIRLLQKMGVDYPSSLVDTSGTLVACVVDGKYAGCLLLADELKDDAIQAVNDLKSLDIQGIHILSGDKQNIVTDFANRLGIKVAIGDLLPEGKVKYMQELQQKSNNRTIFVGDGMNDAPVLATSNIGVAMGGLGSDMAIETADVVIQDDKPSKVAMAIKIGRRTRHIINENIYGIIGVKVLVMLLGVLGIATLWEAVFADVGVALIAIANAMRINKLS